jgi:Cu/Ag efflux pump CusA
LTGLAVYAVLNTPVDAIPDLSENQVVVFTDWMGRSPREIEDQVTYPLSLKLQGLAGVKAVRSTSEFNYSMITVIFEDSVGFYFARERVLEKLTLASTFLPPASCPTWPPTRRLWVKSSGTRRTAGNSIPAKYGHCRNTLSARS